MLQRALPLFFLALVSLGSAVEINHYRPQGELNSNEVAFWGEVSGEESGQLQLLVDGKLVDQKSFSGGRTGFPAGVRRQVSDGSHSWTTRLQASSENYSRTSSFTVGRREFRFRYADKGLFQLQSPPGKFVFRVNGSVAANQTLERGFEGFLRLEADPGLYSYSVSLERDDEKVSETGEIRIDSIEELPENENVIQASYEEEIREEPSNWTDGLEKVLDSGRLLAMAAVILAALLLAAVTRRREVEQR